MEILDILLKVAGGLGIFLLGMKHLSEGLQAVSGKRLRNFIASATTHRIAGVLTGTCATVIVQSSSIITVMVVGLVTTGLMSLTQAINVIIGSNIGTTATAWLIAVLPNVELLGLAMISFASIFYFFSNKERVRNIGLACLGFGLIFFGLDLMKDGMDPVSKYEGIKTWFAMLHADSVWGLTKCIVASAVLTAVIQSSAATTAISMTLAQQGLISFETAMASVLGMNIGTTITAWLASMGGTTESKRAALAHTLFNLIGVLIFLPFFLPVIIPQMKALFPNALLCTTTADGATFFPHIAAPMAYVHTAFNVINTCIFLPFVKVFARFVTRLVPDKPGQDIPRLTVLNAKVIRSPILAVEQAVHEVMFMADSDLDLLVSFRRLLQEGRNENLEEHIFHRENILDTIQREITDFLGQIMTGRLPRDVAFRARTMLRITDEFESVSDEAASLLKMLRRMWKLELSFSEQGLKEILEIHDTVAKFAVIVTDAARADSANRPAMLVHMRSDSDKIKNLIKHVRGQHIARVENNTASPLMIVVCMDILNAYNRIKEDYVNIAETLLGGK